LAKSQLDVLKTATSELTSNDAIDLSLLIQKNLEEDSTGKALKEFARSELLIQQHKYRESEKIMDSLEVKYPHNALKDDILMARYRIHFSEGNYAQAAVNLQTLIDLYPKGIWADDALFHLAELNENQFKQGTKAGSLYEKLFILYPGSFYAGESRKRFRKLRGDTLN
jgi:TolA-binding protein